MAIADPSLPPLERFFAPATYDALQVSPDGRWLSYVGPQGGIPNLFVAPVERFEDARPLTRFENRGIQARDVSGNVMYRWSASSRHLVYPVDRDGDERWQLHRVDVESGEALNLTPFDGAQAEIVTLSARHPDEILVAIREHSPGPPELQRIELTSGARHVVEPASEFLGFLADDDLRPRVAVKLAESSALEVHASAGDGEWRRLATIEEEDEPAFSASVYQRIFRIDARGDALYCYDSRGRDTAALVRLDLEDGTLEVLAEDPRVDIGGVLYHPTQHRPQAYSTVWTRRSWHVIDDAIRDDLDFLRNAAEGDLDVMSRSADDRIWTVKYALSDEPERFCLYDRERRELRELFVGTPLLDDLELVPMHPVVIQSRDGFDLVSYLMLPPGSDPDRSGRPESPVPLLLLVHGGPNDERAQYGYGPFVQWLASRGYGVFYVNYRGSPGFGKKFMNAARFEWGGKMHDDLLDQVEWAIREGITTRDRVGILGGSYGGYAVLVGMTMTPDVFACGVDLVGPSSIEKPMPHWTEEGMARSMGDPRTPEGRALLKSRSPLNFAHQIRHPILIGQGANDSRVPQEQSDQMVEVMQRAGTEVVYALYPDEGHGLYRQENNLSFWAITEIFLARCLGQRYRPLTNELEGSSLQVPVGAEHIPGLEEALARRGDGE